MGLGISHLIYFMKESGDRQSLNRDLIIKTITLTLEEVLKTACNEIPHEKTPFHGAVPPAVSIEEYIKRVEKYAFCSDSVYVMTLVYIDRLQERNPEFVLNRFSIHR